MRNFDQGIVFSQTCGMGEVPLNTIENGIPYPKVVLKATGNDYEGFRAPVHWYVSLVFHHWTEPESNLPCDFHWLSLLLPCAGAGILTHGCLADGPGLVRPAFAIALGCWSKMLVVLWHLYVLNDFARCRHWWDNIFTSGIFPWSSICSCFAAQLSPQEIPQYPLAI